ncbi:MAG: hypothetical protein ACSHXK_14060 [Oceanococcus sp.]
MADRAQLYKYKGDRCTSCGMSVQEMVKKYGKFERMFELHHIDPSSKDPKYKNLIRQQLSAKQIEEVDKCTLLCGQCHSILHAQNITAKLKLSVNLDGREIAQTLSGWVILDLEKKLARFITNQQFMLQPCIVTFAATKDPEVLCCLEIEKPENLLSWLHSTEELGRIEILSYGTKEPLLIIEADGPKQVKVTQKIGFPVTAMNMATDGAKKDNLWIRNGYVLEKDGVIHTEGKFSYTCKLL